MKKILLILLICIPFISNAQLITGLSIGNSVVQTYKNGTNYNSSLSGLCPLISANIGYKIIYLFEPVLSLNYSILKTQNEYNTTGISTMLGAKGSFLKTKLSPIYHLAIGYNFFKMTANGPYTTDYSRKSQKVISMLAAGGKYSINNKFRLEVLLSFFFSELDLPVLNGIYEMKYNYVTPMIGVTYSFSKK